MEFKHYVVISFAILLFIFYCITYFTAKGQQNVKWIPEIAPCPDYWDINSSGQCANVKNLGVCKDPIDLSTMSSCEKYQWATNCGVAWDGITYSVPNPCN